MGIFEWIFGPNHKDVICDNGLNQIFRKKERKKILEEQFYKKNGKREGKYESYYLNEVVHISANYVNGKLHGKAKEFSASGNCYRYVETYENGILKNRKVYFTGFSKPILDHKEKLKELANEQNFDENSSEKGYAYEDIESIK
jgi:antitoxin component YwqK of YwqJK toxin-antitoxin module